MHIIRIIQADKLSEEEKGQNSEHTGFGNAYPFCPQNLTPLVGLIKVILPTSSLVAPDILQLLGQQHYCKYCQIVQFILFLHNISEST